MNKNALLYFSLCCLCACSVVPPKHPENLCSIFAEKEGWYQDALNAEQHWGVSIAAQMAILYQESSFIADAKPPRPLILGFIPWFRSSSAYGYAQAKDETWHDYQNASGNNWASRADFADSCDFVAWYCRMSQRKLGIEVNDVKKLYLSYHEGLSGYQKNTHAAKAWLLNAAEKTRQRALRYAAQLNGCRQQLEAYR